MEKITDFIQKNRIGIFIFGGLLFAFVVGFIVFLYIQDLTNKNAIAESEILSERFETLRWHLEDENYSDEVNALFSELESFAKKNRGLAASRVYSFLARIHSARGDWALCEEAWLKAAQIGDKTYMAPIAFFNAGAAAEEQGNIEKAIEYLKKSIEHPFEFPAAPRAQFNIGRLYQQSGNKQAAIEAYRVVLIDWQNIPVWQHLARSAIIALEIEME
jgi:tetratricopeptide (TPR) repeat protein